MRETGVVRWFDRSLGYGYVKRSTDEIILIHYTEVKDFCRLLRAGEFVEFEVGHGPAGLFARQIIPKPNGLSKTQ